MQMRHIILHVTVRSSLTVDFELQALILEIGFRLLPPSERTSYISKWFESEDLQQLFSSIQDTSFEPVSSAFIGNLDYSYCSAH